ncbi:MAG: hypothetical protein H0V39_03850 [Nitrosomonas sp.]|nr:hypothetical protein [Nitrosomonas sp.]
MLKFFTNPELQQRKLKELSEHERSRMRALLSATTTRFWCGIRPGLLFGSSRQSA